MKWSNIKVMVMGAGGFIGSHLTEALVKKGAKVKAFLKYNSRNDIGCLKFASKQIVDELDICFGEICELESVRKAMKGADIVFNLAALVGIPYSYKHPEEVFETNAIGTLNIMSAARNIGIKRIVQTSTSEVYGTAKYIPIDEEHPLQPQSPYSASKVAADAIAISFHKSFGLPVTIIRPFNTYGPRQSNRAVIPTIITQVLTSKTIKLGSLKPTRDFNYVTDIVEGFIKIAESDAAIGKVINIGSNTEISVGDLVQKIIKLTGRDVRIKQDKIRFRPPKSEVQRLCANNRKAARLIRWRPKVTLDEGLKHTIDFISKNLDYYKVDEYVV